MTIQVENININYEDLGSKRKKTLVFLHGWGQNIKMMKALATPFSKNFRVVIIDLPGFGLSEAPKESFMPEDYADILKDMLDKLKIKKPTLIGHSFGGKISLIYASKYEVEKLILFGAPFKKEIKKESLKLKTLKLLKKVPVINKLEEFAKKHIGSDDYKNADPIMRKILVNTVNNDITYKLKDVKTETLLIWGSNDEAVDLDSAKELEKLLENSGLVVYEGATHYAYLERLNQTINVMKSFLEVK